MNWKKVIGIIVAIAIVAFIVFRLKTNKKIAKERVFEYNKEQAILIQADTIQIENTNSELSYSGTFEPNKETKISTDIQGKVNAVLVDVGSIVYKGQSLVLLDNSLLQLQLKSIELQIEGLEADVNRYTILAQADAIQGVQLEKAELGLRSAKVQQSTLQEQIKKTSIKAPFTGVITAKLSEVGTFAAPGVPLLQITDIATLKFTVNVSENELRKFKFNQSYHIIADAYTDLELIGKASMIGSKANMGSSFPVQFIVKNTPDLKIKSGMSGKVNVKNFTTQETGILIPSSAIVGSSDQPQIYLIKKGRAVLQNISISVKVQNKVLVSDGLKEGDIIVTGGFINLFDGANVIVK
jgi:RND family efflux transporter MFP subunit